MSLYIHRENLELLWSIIQKNPLIDKVPDRETWFRSFIQMFYEKAEYIHMNATSLNQLNRQTLAAMVDDLKNISRMRSGISEPVLPLNSGSKERMAEYEQQFKQRQLEYKPIQPVLPEINFSEKMDDDAITNMDELIRRQKEMREYDISRVLENMPAPPQIESIKSIKQTSEVDELKTMVLELKKTVDRLREEVDALKEYQ